MRLNEISDEEKSFLTLQGISFDFTVDYDNTVSAFSIIGKSRHRRQLLIDDINLIFSRISPFLQYGFDKNDPDVIAAKDIYNRLLDIKNKL
jgi:hypothetical protein